MKLSPLLIAASILSYNVSAADYSVPIENCVKAAEAVKNNDAALLKPLVRDLNPEEEKAMTPYLAKIHTYYTKGSYQGIRNFRTKDVQVIENAKASIYQDTRENAEKYDYDEEIWVNYSFDTSRVDKKDAVKSGQCKFAQIGGRWVMMNVLN
ncbi:hypothetical protein [Pseudoalteromonas sp. T1lg10]|uniref:hypothetical protein n=1 Tax=Pseudoalteromonas sp. T1lg10 TaxID=2077093 RepID=UPI000CF65F08|nr:hypothetical protein [Pseudoalteromonas sp. T1lg10]